MLGEILEKIGMQGLDEKIIAIRAKEAEMEDEALEGQYKDDVDNEKIIDELEKTHIDTKTGS